MEQIDIVINEDGTFSADRVCGEDGAACEDTLRKLLAQVETCKPKRKPEYYRRAKAKVSAKRGGP